MRSTLLPRIFIIISILLVLLTVGCSPLKEQLPPSAEEPSREPLEPVEKPEPTEEEILKERIMGMTFEEKLGQMVMIGIGGFTATEEELNLISENKIGGVILFQRNIKDADQVKELINSLIAANEGNPLPLIIGIDEEGGRVSRLSGIFDNLPPAAKLGEEDDLDLSYSYGAVQASKLRNLGFNLNFSPVLDVSSNPSNPVIGNRAISSDPFVAERNGESIIIGLMDGGIVPVGKHFPGHGDTSVDSHLTLPRITKNIEDMYTLELVPFIGAIEAGIPAIMVGHLMVEDIDDLPATISEKMINGLLRENLGFKGVVFSDDMTMGAIAENYEISSAVVDFIRAGGDIALICHGVQPVNEALQKIMNSYLEGSLDEKDINEHVLRIMMLKADIEENVDKVDVPETSEVEFLIEELLKKMGDM
ncbi:beta-N-acetylhexosaminidase [Gudongella oleilytica]|jgi:beta-N-acetylhexosaminidase|uniref:beta-N-acetylhexosaminidase n=1 Tax=Gudongella oleilytica TaxID=1582259 RepID=UPI000FF8913A|nr:beta-N-acetylhexosaminidase [Gudongella oleilytica]MDY0257036.1 beta-N-acetylhexosaminidase [Gudongella oleilytica]